MSFTLTDRHGCALGARRGSSLTDCTHLGHVSAPPLAFQTFTVGSVYFLPTDDLPIPTETHRPFRLMSITVLYSTVFAGSTTVSTKHVTVITASPTYLYETHMAPIEQKKDPGIYSLETLPNQQLFQASFSSIVASESLLNAR